MWPAQPGAVENLLQREARAALPLVHQLRLYFDPGVLFKDASRGSVLVREQARRYNARHRWMLLTYVRRWMTIATLFFGAVGAAEALGVGQPFAPVVAASFALACCIAVVVSIQTFIAYLLLGASEAGSGSR